MNKKEYYILNSGFKRFLVLTSLFSLLSSLCLHGAFNDTGWGVRPAGMGGAFCAIADDVNAPLYNPGGLNQLDKKEATFMYAKPYMGLENVSLGRMFLGYVHPIDSGVVGINCTNFNGTELYRENSFSISYAREIYRIKGTGRFYAGMNLKYLTHKYFWDKSEVFKQAAEYYNDPVVASGNSAGAVTADFGILVQFGEKVSVGLAGSNINQPDIGLYYEDKVPMELRFGVAYKIPNSEFISGLDFSYRNQEWGKSSDKQNVHFGCEKWFSEHTYGARLGVNKDEASTGISFCKGFSEKLVLQIDYAIIWSFNIADNIGSHRIGTTVRF
ncbi:MAG: conjugal transfer protein TraF [Elusimicrobia bacterium]|nr:conjugal transfer protein TraF [Elusimicrobiota bacterium]